jgi:hypothetical protein
VYEYDICKRLLHLPPKTVSNRRQDETIRLSATAGGRGKAKVTKRGCLGGRPRERAGGMGAGAVTGTGTGTKGNKIG